MKRSLNFLTALITLVVLSALPALAQNGGLGVGVGLGGQTAVQAGGGNIGVNTNTGVHAKAPVEATTRTAGHATATATDPSGAAIAAHIENNPQLAARVQSMLPAGVSMTSASSGFKNEGQFLAALHASHNLEIPFDQLKANMTGSHSMSLGSAIKASKSEMSDEQAKQEAKKAETEAKAAASAKGKAAASAKQ